MERHYGTPAHSASNHSYGSNWNDESMEHFTDSAPVDREEPMMANLKGSNQTVKNSSGYGSSYFSQDEDFQSHSDHSQLDGDIPHDGLDSLVDSLELNPAM